ncbi:MAG: hypothetical protein WC661_01400 [Opitutaceae bacterium]|jgi:hypothetical protein
MGLSYEIVDETPRPFDFGEGYGLTWELGVDRTDDEVANCQFEPIYNRLYPVGERFVVPTDWRTRLNNMTVVRVLETPYLALTGCGMDFTWEICETYLNVGYYPPASLCRLPAMAGRGRDLRDQRIIGGCCASLESLVRRYQLAIESNKGL